MTDIRDADEVWVGTSKNADYVVATPEDGFVRFLRADTIIPRVAFERAMQEAVEAERERCAKIASDARKRWPSGNSDYSRGALIEAQHIENLIRATQEPSE